MDCDAFIMSQTNSLFYLLCFCSDLKNANDGIQLEHVKRDVKDSRTGELANCKSERIRSERSATSFNGPRKNYACAHPSYLKTLGQSHSDWIFGAIAEFVDNSRDAKATMYSFHEYL